MTVGAGYIVPLQYPGITKNFDVRRIILNHQQYPSRPVGMNNMYQKLINHQSVETYLNYSIALVQFKRIVPPEVEK
jgi:hypothetical protein